MTAVLQKRYLALKKAQKGLKANTAPPQVLGDSGDAEMRIRDLEQRLAKAEAELRKTQSAAASVRATASRTEQRLNKLLGVPLGVKKWFGGRKSS